MFTIAGNKLSVVKEEYTEEQSDGEYTAYQ
jgi:hypothetical protein